ncbi:hypothetical protein CVU75_03665 [Candidatus Dependentiae bacterium HGW-Dependentiae-1]|nr:MAG: hypothetical protein CVU75_03665 [Candidatus Dependentiae bacterium HGW-Dependentiae-1]
MKGIFNTALVAALLFSQVPVSAMHPTAKKALALGAGAITVATVKHFKNARVLAQAQTAQRAAEQISFFNKLSPLHIAGIIAGVAGIACYKYHTNKQYKAARDFCLQRLEEAKIAACTWQTDNGAQAKTCFFSINRLFMDEPNCKGTLMKYGKQHLTPYITKLSSNIPKDARWSRDLVRYDQTTAPIADQETANRMLAHYDRLINLIRAQ